MTSKGGLKKVERLARYYERVGQEFLSSLQEVSRTSKGEIIYNCPWCEERYGPNEKRFYPKLYYNPQKQTGFCFRCGTVVLVSNSPQELSDPDLSLAPSLEDRGDGELSEIKDLSLLFPLEEDNIEAMRYILWRSPYFAEVIRRYRDRIVFYDANFGGGLRGVVFPFTVEGKVYSYQVRFYREDGSDPEVRYETRPGLKIPYSPFGIRLGPTESLTLVEGVFGTFGILYLSQNLHLFYNELMKMGLDVASLKKALSNPIATLGYNLSDSVLWFIKEMAPVHVVIAMDERELSLKARELVSKIVVSVERVDILNIGDPDDFATSLYTHVQVGR